VQYIVEEIDTIYGMTVCLNKLNLKLYQANLILGHMLDILVVCSTLHMDQLALQLTIGVGGQADSHQGRVVANSPVFLVLLALVREEILNFNCPRGWIVIYSCTCSKCLFVSRKPALTINPNVICTSRRSYRSSNMFMDMFWTVLGVSVLLNLFLCPITVDRLWNPIPDIVELDEDTRSDHLVWRVHYVAIWGMLTESQGTFVEWLISFCWCLLVYIHEELHSFGVVSIEITLAELFRNIPVHVSILEDKHLGVDPSVRIFWTYPNSRILPNEPIVL